MKTSTIANPATVGKTLVIAEKPSVAQDIVRALTATVGRFDKHDEYFENEHYVVSSAVGHLVEIQAPEAYDVKRGKWSFAHLPVIPPHFDLKPVEKTKTRLSAVVRLAKRKDVGQLINACDAGREGELIFRLIEQYAGGAKPLGKPVSRLWLQSMTPQAIRDGFGQLRSNAQMQPLADAARCRSEADWLVGINGTRAMTAFNSRDGGFFLTTVGRVQTPTLSVVVEREEQIRQFISRDYWEIHASFNAQAGQYPGKWFDPQWKKNPDDAEHKADRLWNQRDAAAIATAVRGQDATVSEESKPTTQASPLLFDLTSLQREANSKFGYSAKTTLSIAQSLYERHKALTYPRTDSRNLPEDYLPVVKQTFAMLADSGMRHLAPFAQTAIQGNYLKPSRRVFDNAKVSDHFAIIPTLQAPSGLSEAEQKVYDLVVRRFMAVFFPSAEYMVTTRITTVALAASVAGRSSHSFKTEGKVLVKPGWLTIYGKEAAAEVADAKEGDKGQNLVPVQPGEKVQGDPVDARALKTKPPARYTEATLLGAMEGAGKTVEDDELREAMQEKGLGTPATRSSIIEGLIAEKYMLREGRELVPTAKAFQLMTLLRGLGVEELSKAELTGEWEYKLALMEQGKLKRETFMAEIAAMTERLVKKAKEYDRETIPGNYATLTAPCPQCGGIVRENYRRYSCTGKSGNEDGCGFSFGKSPAGRTFELAEVEQFLRDRHIGPLDGFRSKTGWPFIAELVIKFDEESKNYKLEFDFGDDKIAEEPGELVAFANQQSLGNCPKCAAPVFEYGKNYVCQHAVPTQTQPTPGCDFKSGQLILQQPIERAQIQKLLATGKTDMLDKFVSTRTRRSFKAMLAWSAEAGKVIFEFAPNKYPSRKTAASAASAAAVTAAPAKSAAGKTVGKTVGKAVGKAVGKTVGKAAEKAAEKATGKTAAKTAPKPKRGPRKDKMLQPSATLAAVIGTEAVARTQGIKKLWEYIRANGLQDTINKRNINADTKLLPLFGKPQINMFELNGILVKHLSE